MRIFVALELPDAWRDAAWAFGESLERSVEGVAPGVLRRVDRSLMHVTLRFLGDVADEDVDAVRGALRDVTGSPFPADLRLGAPGSFGAPARTSTAWVGVEGDLAGLAELADRIEAAVRELGLSPDTPRLPPLRPHITVARVRRGATPEQRRAIARAVAGVDPPKADPGQPTTVALMRSRLLKDGARYELIERF